MKQPRGISIQVTGLRDRKLDRAIGHGLLAYNVAKIGRMPRGSISVGVRGPRGVILGGLQGFLFWGWLYVNMFWLDEKTRGKGIGSAVLAAAEKEAARRKCFGVYLDTGSFQAPGFYRKQGYKQFANLIDFPPGHSRYSFYKKLKPAAAAKAEPKASAKRAKRR